MSSAFVVQKQTTNKKLINDDNNNKKWKLNRPHATHSRANDSTRVKTKSVLPHWATKYAEVYFRKKYQNTQNNAPKRYAHTVGNRCDSAKCCVAAVYTYKYNINTILSRAIQQRYSQFEGLGKKAGSRDRTAGLTSRTRLVRSTLPASNLTQIHYSIMVVVIWCAGRRSWR